MNSAVEYIQNWTKTRESFYFFLPNYHNGRPFDANYKIMEIQEIDDGIIIKFSGEVEILFEGDITCEDEFCNLLLKGFSRLVYIVSGNIRGEFYEGEFCLCGF